MNYKSTIEKGQQTPSICQLCSSIHKCRGEVSDTPQENSCFVEKDLSYTNDESIKERIMTYKPFTNSKKTVRTICDKFAHVRTLSIR